MAPSYRWTCFACNEPVAAGVDRCHNCGCPAKATVALIRAYRDALAGAEPVIRSSATTPLLTQAERVSLSALRRNLTLLLAVGLSVALLGSLLLHQYWAWSATRIGVGTIGFAAIGLIFGPSSAYLARYVCPRCKSNWLSAAYSSKRHGAFIIWAVAHWKTCAFCGLSTDSLDSDASSIGVKSQI